MGDMDRKTCCLVLFCDLDRSFDALPAVYVILDVCNGLQHVAETCSSNKNSCIIICLVTA